MKYLIGTKVNLYSFVCVAFEIEKRVVLTEKLIRK